MKSLFANPDIGLIGLLFFFAFFVGLLIWLYRPGAGKKYSKYGDIPLEDDKDDHGKS